MCFYVASCICTYVNSRVPHDFPREDPFLLLLRQLPEESLSQQSLLCVAL